MKKKFFAVALATTMALSTGMTAMAADSISGNLNVTSFFGAKTDAVELKSGDTYTFTFKNKSNGTNNYENYVMAITGATGDAYTGATEEVLIIRADNWGWGGGMSDFVAPDQTSGNVLKFETSVTDWDAWKAASQAGFDCTVTIARDGDTLTYDAKTGEHTFKTTAKSGKALPESCYVFFTGENVDLTGFKTEKKSATAETPAPAPDNKKEETPAPAPAPDNKKEETPAPAPNNGSDNGNSGKPSKTGDTAPVAALAVAAVVAGAAVVASKKRVTE